jgi:hypothetical protein
MIRDLANDRQKVQTLIDNVRRDNDVWHWTWQAAVLKKMFRLFEAQPENPAFHALSHIPRDIVTFEIERRHVNHESSLN